MATDLPALALGTKPRLLSGAVLGLHQQVLLVTLRVYPPAGLDLAVLDLALENLLPEASAVPDDRSEKIGDDPSVALISRLHQIHAEVQRELSIPVFGACAIFSQPIPVTISEGASHFLVALPCAQIQATQTALHWALTAINALVAGASPGDLRSGLDVVRKALRPWGLRSTNAIHFLGAAHKLGIQVTPLTQDTVALGQGANTRWLHSSITDCTPATGVHIARNKFAAALVLSSFGLPVPRHDMVASEDQALAVADRLGYPVVIKPHDQDQGRGVFAGLKNETSLRKAYQAARKFSNQILVEKHHFGEDYRFTVVHGRVVKIMHRRPGGVLGDGIRSITALLAEVQASPEHRRALRRTGKMRLDLDEEALELLDEQGLDAAAVPAAGHFVCLRRKNNISAGGTYVTLAAEAAHPDNNALAVRAAHALNLDMAGIDLIMADLATPWHETGAVICEINAQPQIGFRDTPEIYTQILREMVAGDGSIPCHLLVVEDVQVPLRLDRFRQLAARLGCNGLSTSAGAWLDDRQCLWKPQNSFAAARALLLDRKVRGLVFAMSPRDILRFGLPAWRLASVRVLADQRSGPVRQALQLLRPHIQRLVAPSTNAAPETNQ